MTRETKVGLLVGMGVILLIGIIVSDHLAVMQQERREAREASDFADRAQRSIEDGAPDATTRQRRGERQREYDYGPPDAAPRREPPTADHHERERERWTPDLTPEPRLAPSPRDRMADQHRMPPVTALDNLEASDNEPYQRLAHTDDGDTDLDALLAEADEPERREPEPIVHRVRSGQTLYEIAREHYGDGNYWRTIAEQNADRVIDGEHVRDGVELTIPIRTDSAPDDADATMRRVAERAEQVMRGESDDGAGRGRASERTITVARGDTLSDLAARHLGTSRRWRELLEANRDQLDSDRDLRAGMTLRLPEATAARGQLAQQSATQRRARTYTIRRGDTLTRIAEQELGDGNRWRELFEANQGKLESPDTLPVGEKIQLPS